MTWMALLIFLMLGWSYYMVASILMNGSIFNGLRGGIHTRASEGNKFCALVVMMLDCLMCTATQSALWTIGLTTLVLGFHYRIPSHVLSVIAGRLISLPLISELVFSIATAFAISVAVAGEAWAINLLIASSSDKLSALRDNCARRENELLARISQLEGSVEVEFDLDD